MKTTKEDGVMSGLLVSDVKGRLYLHDLDAETLRWLGDSLEEYATAVRAEEEAGGQKKMRHAHSAMLRLWADRFRTDANRMEDTNGGPAARDQ